MVNEIYNILFSIISVTAVNMSFCIIEATQKVLGQNQNQTVRSKT